MGTEDRTHHGPGSSWREPPPLTLHALPTTGTHLHTEVCRSLHHCHCSPQAAPDLSELHCQSETRPQTAGGDPELAGGRAHFFFLYLGLLRLGPASARPGYLDTWVQEELTTVTMMRTHLLWPDPAMDAVSLLGPAKEVHASGQG